MIYKAKSSGLTVVELSSPSVKAMILRIILGCIFWFLKVNI